MLAELIGGSLLCLLAYSIGGIVGHTIGDICRLVLRKPRS